MVQMRLLFAMMLPLILQAEFDLDKVRWRNRVVLVFAPTASNASFVKQKKILEEYSCGVRERDIITVLSPPGNFRRRFNIVAARFHVLLIGKDGRVKLRHEKPVSAEELFATIDAMPMRRSEMQVKASSCR